MTPQKLAASEQLKWLRIGDDDAEASEEHLKQGFARAVTAGFAYMRAKAATRHGDWEMFVECNSRRGPRSVRSYMQLVDELLEWLGLERKPDSDLGKLEKAVFTLLASPLPSPKPWVKHWRLLAIMKPFGQYLKVVYERKRQQKLLGNGQLELNLPFEKVFASVSAVKQLGSAGVRMSFPDGKDKREALKELIAEFESGLAALNAELETFDVDSGKERN